MQKLFGVRVGPKAAAEVLATRFGGEHPGGAGAARMTIMLVDEMDQMLKGRQEVSMESIARRAGGDILLSSTPRHGILSDRTA